jgi:hypothetical protein
MRRLELQAGAPRRQGGRGGWSTNDAMRHAERELDGGTRAALVSAMRSASRTSVVRMWLASCQPTIRRL